MRRVLRWLVRILVALVALIVLAVIGLVVALHTGWGRKVVRHQVEQRLAEAFPGGAKVGGFSGSPFGELVLTDVEIDGPDHRPAFSAKTVRLEIGLVPLISKELWAKRVIIDDLDVRLVRAPDGKVAASELLAPGPKSTWSVRLPAIEIHRAHVHSELGGRVIDVDDIQLDGALHVPYGGPLDASIVVAAKLRDPATPFTVAGSFHIGDDAVMIHGVTGKLGDAAIAAAAVRIPTGDARPVAGPPFSGAVALAQTHAQPSGTVAVFAPAAQVRTLGVDVPADVAIAIEATADGSVALAGRYGDAPVRGLLHVDLETRSANGFVTAAALPLAQLTGGKVTGSGGALAALDVDHARRATGVIAAWGDVADRPHATALVALDATEQHADVTVAAGGGGLSVGIAAAIRRAGRAIDLERGVVIARTLDPAHAIGKPVHGKLRADVVVHGALAPEVRLAVAGTIDGTHVELFDMSASELHLRLDATGVPAHPTGHGRAEFIDLRRGAQELGKLTITAGDRADGKLAVTVRSLPKQAPWQIDADALITLGDTIVIELQHHLVRTASGNTWTGHTGRLAIAPDKISLADFESTSARGRIAASGSYGRRTGAITAKLSGALDTGLLGVPGHTDFAVDARPGKITASADANGGKLGAGNLALELDAPANLGDSRAWRRLGRAAVRDAKLELHAVDLAEVSKLAQLARPVAGRVDGNLEITPGDATGKIALRGVSVAQVKDLGTVDADVDVHQAQGAVTAVLAATLQKVGKIEASATAAPPDHLFDLAAWHRLGLGAVRDATLRANDLVVHPGTFERLGIVTNLRGRVSFALDARPPQRDATLVIDIADLRGGPIVQPIAVHVDGQIDQRSTRARVAVRSKNVTLLSLEATTPLAIDRLRVDPRTLPLQATVKLPSAPAHELLAVLGNTQAVQGTIDGDIAIAGTLARPTATAKITVHDVGVPPGGTGPFPMLHELAIDARWDGAAGKVTVHGDESTGGKLDIAVAGRPGALAAVTATLHAQGVELAPLVALAPGPAGGLAGKLDASLELHGLDPHTSKLGGSLTVTEGRIPIAPAIGTLFHGNIRITVAGQMVQITADGMLGKGKVSLGGTIPIAAGMPTSGKLQLAVRKIQLIGETEPIISSDITAEVARKDDEWQANVKLANTTVDVPSRKGEKLAPVGPPDDVRYTRQPWQPRTPPGVKPPPARPTLVADVDLGNIDVESKELRGEVTGKLRISLGLPGDGVGMYGHLSLDRGDLDLFDRRYLVDRAGLHFDGTTDPLLDVRITYDFPEVTTITEVHGRLSKPELDLSSSPNTYSQGELLGFLLGGEPGGDPSSASAQQKVTSAGESLVANQIGGYVKKALPVDIDVLRYEAATATTSAAVTVGTWLSRALFLAYRQHLESRPDENTGEVQLEYWLRRRLMLEGTIGDRSYDGLDLLWRRRW